MPIVQLDELEELRSKIRSGKGNPKKVVERLTSAMGPTIWRSAYWKKARAERIGTSCVVCESTKAPLVLQHLWQPPRQLAAMERRLQPAWYEFEVEFAAKQPRPELPAKKVEIQERNVCPSCNGISTRSRKKMTPRFVCETVTNGKRCSFKWDEPNIHPVEISKPRPIGEWMAYERKRKTWVKRMGAAFAKSDIYRAALRETALIISDDYERYLSLKDTTTFCRSCAYKWDRQGKRLCSGCEKRLSSPGKLCVECDPEYAKCQQCNERYHRQAYDRCLRCEKALMAIPPPSELGSSLGT